MKTHAAFLKNIAAFLMLVALGSLLLPFCKITTVTGSATVSGVEVLKIGVDVGYEYYSEGDIEDDCIIWDGLTWGDMRDGVANATDQEGLSKAVVCGGIASLPILFCILSMFFTFIAEGKKTMVLPTLLIAMTVIETIVLMIAFFKLRQLLIPSIDITLLLGIYAFFLFSTIALIILVLLWLTGGFAKPKQKDSNTDQEKERRKNRKRSSDRDKSEKKRWGNRKRKKRTKKKRKKNKKENKQERWYRKERENHAPDRTDDQTNDQMSGRPDDQTNDRMYERTDNQTNDQTNDQTAEKTPETTNGSMSGYQIDRGITANAVGHITGLTGMYQGIDLENLKLSNGAITIGTTPEVMNALQTGKLRNLDQLARNNCVIEYSEANKQYTITSHSVTQIMLKTGRQSESAICLKNGESQTVGSDSILYIGDDTHCIRLE